MVNGTGRRVVLVGGRAYELGALAGGGGGPHGHGRGGGDLNSPNDCGDPYGGFRGPDGSPIHRRGGAGAAYTEGEITVRGRSCYEVREYPIGFTGTITKGSTSPIESKPQVIYRGERLAIPASIVGNFDVADIKVGKNSQEAADGNLAGECFSNLSVGVRMVLDTAEPGILIVLSVENNDTNNDHPFKAVLFGTVMEI